MTLTTRPPLESIKKAAVEHSQPNPAPRSELNDHVSDLCGKGALVDGLSSAERNVANGMKEDYSSSQTILRNFKEHLNSCPVKS